MALSRVTPIVSGSDLRAALSPETYMNIYDDDNTGSFASVDSSVQVANDLRSAHIWVVSGLAPVYSSFPDGTDSEYSQLLFSAELEYAKYLAFKRRPEYTRTLGRGSDREESLSRAKDIIDMICAGLMRIIPQDAPPEGVPRNVGGVTIVSGNSVMLPAPDGTPRSGDF